LPAAAVCPGAAPAFQLTAHSFTNPGLAAPTPRPSTCSPSGNIELPAQSSQPPKASPSI